MGQDSMEKAKAFIQAHLTEEWILEMLAKEVECSPYHFARLFRKAAGRSVMDYVREKRIDAAAEQLRHRRSLPASRLCRRRTGRPGPISCCRFNGQRKMNKARALSRPGLII